MAENSTRLKMMKLYQILRTEADEDHPVSRQSLLKFLEAEGVPCHPRTVTRLITALNDSGYEVIEEKRGHEKFYFVPDRTFSISELKIIIDAI